MASEPSSPAILVVDDNEQNRALAQATLEDEGFEVLLASSGAEALRLLETTQPGCVLLDVRMPEMDGFEVCRAIRQMPWAEELPIVFLTAQRDLETFERAQQAGGDDFLTKPVQPGELAIRVRAALRMRRMGQELREHYDLVRKQRDDLMRLNLQKERLGAFVVHDLKNPINAMELHAQVILRKLDRPERVKDSAERIRSEARALLRMVLNLLDISRSEEGDIELRRGLVDAPALIGQLLDEFEVKARAAEVQLVHASAPLELSADPDLLRRVIENLLDNAIRHAPKGSEVEVRASRIEGEIELCVADRGRGIPEALREQVFDRYVQTLNDGYVSRAGRGLGLAFCKLAVEAHGGRIWSEDRRPGTAFRIRLPG